MAYKINHLEMAEARDRITGYRYALLYMTSEIRLCRTEDLAEVNWPECQEARFFSEDGELHIFTSDGDKKAVEVADGDAEEGGSIIRKYQLGGRFRELGDHLCVKEYLDYDSDGQAGVALTRLVGTGGR